MIDSPSGSLSSNLFSIRVRGKPKLIQVLYIQQTDKSFFIGNGLILKRGKFINRLIYFLNFRQRESVRLRRRDQSKAPFAPGHASTNIKKFKKKKGPFDINRNPFKELISLTFHFRLQVSVGQTFPRNIPLLRFLFSLSFKHVKCLEKF